MTSPFGADEPPPEPLPEAIRLEIANRKYSADVTLILPLSNGEFAVLSAERRLRAVVASLEDATTLVLNPPSVAVPPPRQRDLDAEAFLADLGL